MIKYLVLTIFIFTALTLSAHDGKDLSEPPPLDARSVDFSGKYNPVSMIMIDASEWGEWDYEKKTAAVTYCLAALIRDGYFPEWNQRDFYAWFEKEDKGKYPDLLHDYEFESEELRVNYEKFLDYYVPIAVRQMDRRIQIVFFSTVGELFQDILPKIDFSTDEWLRK